MYKKIGLRITLMQFVLAIVFLCPNAHATTQNGVTCNLFFSVVTGPSTGTFTTAVTIPRAILLG
jgi:hypothetical protein